jgi:hypothetical protein
MIFFTIIGTVIVFFVAMSFLGKPKPTPQALEERWQRIWKYHDDISSDVPRTRDDVRSKLGQFDQLYAMLDAFSKDAGAISSDLSSEQFGRFFKASMELVHNISLSRDALRHLLRLNEAQPLPTLETNMMTNGRYYVRPNRPGNPNVYDENDNCRITCLLIVDSNGRSLSKRMGEEDTAKARQLAQDIANDMRTTIYLVSTKAGANGVFNDEEAIRPKNN